MLSAQLDGEDDPGDRLRTEEHLAGCAACRQWLDRAAAVNRLTRTRVAAGVPDLSAAILAALPPVAATARARRVRLTAALFVALGVVGAVQLILGLAQVGGGATGVHPHTTVGLAATPGHLWHESAAWNVAVGAGFLFIALRRTRPTGLVPMLTAFVGMLLLLSVNDLTGGRVDGRPPGQSRFRDRRLPHRRRAVPRHRGTGGAARRTAIGRFGLAGPFRRGGRTGRGRQRAAAVRAAAGAAGSGRPPLTARDERRRAA